MRISTCFCLAFVCLAVNFVPKVNSRFSLEEALDKVGDVVKVVTNIVLLTKRVKKSYREFEQEVKHARVIFTEGESSYRVEKVTPCAEGHHDIVKAKQPVEIHLQDDMVVLQDRYCRKCGQHFFSQPREEL